MEPAAEHAEAAQGQIGDDMVKTEEDDEKSIPASQLDLYKARLDETEGNYTPEEYELLRAETLRFGEEEAENAEARSPEIPAVTREEQQAFKEKNAKVKQSDGHSDYATKKRPPAQPKKGPKKKAQKVTENFQPVVEEAVEAEEDVGGARRNLSEDFAVEAELEAETVKPKRPEAKGKPKAKATAKTAAKAKAKAKATAAQPGKGSGKNGKGSLGQKGKGKGKALEQQPKPKEQGKKGEKATFAGRRPPATEAALARYNAMQVAFEECLADTLTLSVGMAEDHVSNSDSLPLEP